VRPIVLIQAESRDKDVSVDVVREYLAGQENIADAQIAVATGERRELDDVNLFDPACPDRAYAHVSSDSWPAAIVQLRDRLVSMGFDETEAERAIREQIAAERAPDLGLKYPDATSGSWSVRRSR
jgi:type III restriction enzyme